MEDVQTDTIMSARTNGDATSQAAEAVAEAMDHTLAVDVSPRGGLEIVETQDTQLPPSIEAELAPPAPTKRRGFFRHLPAVVLGAGIGVLGALAASRTRRR